MEMGTTKDHKWRFFRVGGFDQVRLDTAEDLRHLDELDQKLWAALSCPVHGLEFDPKTLAMLDSDEDGRVRVPEIRAAVQWSCAMLKNLTPLLEGRSELPLSAINESSAAGQMLAASARQILSYLGKGDAKSITIEDVTSTETLLHDSKFNGDGVITSQSTDDPSLVQVITDIMACVGEVPDRSGAFGIGMEQITAFFEAAAQYSEWWGQASADQGILPFGETTAQAATLFKILQPKINDYFTRCRLAQYDAKAEDALNPALTAYEAIASQGLNACTTELEAFPLARIEAGRPLPLQDGVNPAWSDAMASFSELIVTPLFGAVDSLESTQWDQIEATFASYDKWQAAKAGVSVEPLGIERIRELLGNATRTDLEALVTEDLSLAGQVDSFESVARLVHFTRDLILVLNNFVAFRDFYAQDRKAIFQAGTLYLDGRACELCVKVSSPDAHSSLANLSRTYLAYCTCTRKGSTETTTIAAAFTGGDADNLMVGRNGVFYDRNGQDWDATIVKIIDHPISVRQAFWAPYKRIARMIGEQIEKFAAAKDKAVDSSAGGGLAGIGAQAEAGKPAPVPFDVGKFAGIFAAIGLAVGAIGTAVASVLGGFLSLPLWQMPLAICGIILLISGPSMLIAFLKLRQRNLGPILDANGWAVNTKACINIPFGATLTKLAEMPKGAERSLRDPFAEKQTPWKRWAALLVLFIALGMAWDKGYIQNLANVIKPMLNKPAVNATVEKPASPASAVPATNSSTSANGTEPSK